jgi:FkbM family methyltransferase
MIAENQSLEIFQDTVKDKKVVLFGVGDICVKFINNCLQSSEQVAYICNAKPLKHGQTLYGIKIVSPDVLQTENKKNTIVVLCTEKSKWEISQLAEGFAQYAAPTVVKKTFTARAHYFAAHKEEFAQIRNLWCDNYSKNVWDKLNIHVQYGITDFSDIMSNQLMYLPNCLFSSALSDKEIVVSAGVHDGKNTKEFCDFFGKKLVKLYAIEPIEACLNLSKENLAPYHAKGYPVNLIKCALLDVEEQIEVIFSKKELTGGGIYGLRDAYSDKFTSYEKETVSARPLDNIIPPEEKVTYIKMDIEGAETKGLLGAKRIIQEHKPRLAICVYHNPEDYFNIPLLIKQFVPEYKFYLRHHSKILSETVLYATL